MLFSCSNTDDVSTNPDFCRLTKVKFDPLLYDYIPNYVPNINTFDNDGVQFEYDDSQKITTIIGGPIRIPTGNGIEWTYSSLPIYEVSYEGSSVIIDSQIETITNENTNRYTIIDGKIISKTVIETLNFFIYEITEFSYSYFDDFIVEYREGELSRTFYFENNNLIKIEKLYYYGEGNPFGEAGTLAGKDEIIFSEFDDTLNLLKDLFFVDGGFYKAFSQNNYHEISFISYEYIDDEFIPYLPGTIRGFNFGISEDGTNAMFNQVCD